MNPRIAGVRISMLAHLYRVRLRSHAVQEALAGSGIAVGVALVLGVLVANTSLTTSAGQVVHEVVGSARLQLTSRSPQGFDEALAGTVSSLPGVAAAAPVLRENAAVLGPHGRASVQLLGVTPVVTQLGGLATRDFGPGGLRFAEGLLLPEEVAQATGAQPGDTVTVLALGQAHTIKVGAILSSAFFGALAKSPVAVTPLSVAQRLTGLSRRIDQVLIRPAPRSEGRVATALRRLAGDTLDVSAADHELLLLDEAARPTEQSTSLFAAISVMVGFLLALNAMLLTVPERRRFVADLRMQGYDWRQILVLLGFQAVVLGLVASGAGIVLGVVLSQAFLHRVPAYLITAFPVGSQQILNVSTVLIALGCGVLATMLASLSPVLDLRPNRPTDAALRERDGGSEVIVPSTTARLAAGGALGIVAITATVMVEPGSTIAGGVALAICMLCAIPTLFAALAVALRWTGERVRSSALIVVVSELRATTTRAVALAGIAALAVYGSVAIGGARDDLLHGLDSNFGEYLQTADIWVTTGGNDLTTNAFFDGGAAARLARLPSIASVRVYQGSFLDVGSRRMWIIARPPGDVPLIPSSQVLSGNVARAEQLVQGGGWAAVSSAFAEEHDLRVGSSFNLPTPTGSARLRVAAVITNLGWSPGAVIVSRAEYSRRWRTADPSALELGLAPGVSPKTARRAVAAALADRPGLGIQTLHERRSQYAADSRQGLQALGEIATLLLIAAALAVASALAAAIWQRRARLASLKIQGYDTSQLWRALLLESSVVLGIGCLVGAAFGIYGHALAGRWVRLNTGFPAPFTLGLLTVFLTLARLAVIALAVISLPGLAAAKASARTSLQE